jgi:hypothetical protein
MTTLLLTPRKPRKKNLRNNMKIMNKPYYLVCENGDRMIVHPPKSMKPGPLADGRDPKDQFGRWQRRFTVTDFMGKKGIDKFILITHFPGEHPNYTDKSGNKWKLEPIPDVHAEKARGKDRKGFRTRTSGGRSGAPSKKKHRIKQESTPAVAVVAPQEQNQTQTQPQPEAAVALGQVPPSDKEPEQIQVVPTAGVVAEAKPQ